MAELFSRVAIGPDEYSPNTWTTFYEVRSNTTGCLSFVFSITNCTPMHGGVDKEITVQVKIVDRDGKLVHYLLTPNILKANDAFLFPSSSKVLKRILLTETIAVSAEEKKPDKANKITNSRICIHKSESIFHTPYIFEYCIILTIF